MWTRQFWGIFLIKKNKTRNIKTDRKQTYWKRSVSPKVCIGLYWRQVPKLNNISGENLTGAGKSSRETLKENIRIGGRINLITQDSHERKLSSKIKLRREKMMFGKQNAVKIYIYYRMRKYYTVQYGIVL